MRKYRNLFFQEKNGVDEVDSMFICTSSKYVINSFTNLDYCHVREYHNFNFSNVVYKLNTGLIQKFHTSPLHQGLLATNSEKDTKIKIWNLKDLKDKDVLYEPKSILDFGETVKNLKFHTIAENTLITSSKSNIKVWDVNYEKEVLKIDHGASDFSFNYDGSLVLTYGEKKLKIFDLRSDKEAQSVDFEGSQGTVTWLDPSCFLTTSFKNNCNITTVIDSKTFEILSSVQGKSERYLFNSFFDEDTSLFFYTNFMQSSLIYDEFLTWEDQLEVGFYRGKPIYGIDKIPKYNLDIDNREVMRFVVSDKKKIRFLSGTVPRKGTKFASDIFKYTRSEEAPLSCNSWLQGNNSNPILIHLDPNYRRKIEEEEMIKFMKFSLNILQFETNIIFKFD